MPKKKKKKSSMTVYTVLEIEYWDGHGTAYTVDGSFINRGDAISECAEIVMSRLSTNPGLRAALYEDETHDEKIRKLIDGSEDWEKDSSAERGIIKSYVMDLLGGAGCFAVKSSSFGNVSSVEFVFGVDENDVECKQGIQLWTCVTSGEDSDNHNPEWEQAFPEVFFSEEEAMECALEDLRQCLDGYERAQKTEILCEARDQLEKDGYYEFELNDSTSRRWDIWSTPIDIGQGSGKIQRP